MNRLFISSVLAITMTIVLGFSVFFLFINNPNEKPALISSTDKTASAHVEKSDHPYLPPSMDEVPTGDEGELIKLGENLHNQTNTLQTAM